MLDQPWRCGRGQEIAEYAVMLLVIVLIVIGTVRVLSSRPRNAHPTPTDNYVKH